MALSELAALEAAYEALRRLDPAGRRRALQWLSDALAADTHLRSMTTGTGIDVTANGGAEPTPADRKPSRTTGSTTRPPRRRASAAAGDTVAAAAAGARSRGRRGGRTSAADAAKRTKATKATARQAARPYRRMPAADQVMAAYRTIGSVSGLAEHFDVPVHTVQGWARQLRRHGYPIGQTR